ncbi:hypothetical protein EK21DRAFT_119384 [Setomelanomma holmii]|uniref:Uncharacterized protein n=1 Tax=Setomelanomma holmii TaxID=210430 RepID=A0A9P4GW45_9PLEO|nr:hypothetical protein EK21DRAFT_119384 [Setomelanomma holmii]
MDEIIHETHKQQDEVAAESAWNDKDIWVAKLDLATHTLTSQRLVSVYCGDEWVKDKLVNIVCSPLQNDASEYDVRLEVDDFYGNNPAPETHISTVLQGSRRLFGERQTTNDPLTILLESCCKDDSSEYIVVQIKGERVHDPVLPADWSQGTIFYELTPGEKASVVKLLATREDLPVRVTNAHMLVAELLAKDTFIDTKSLWIVGESVVQLAQPATPSSDLYLVQVVNIQIHQGHQTAQAEALLLSANHDICRREGAGENDLGT